MGVVTYQLKSSSSSLLPSVSITQTFVSQAAIGSYRHVILAFITSQIPTDLLETDIVLDSNHPDFSQTGLRKPSTLRLHQVMTAKTSLMLRELGALSDETQAEIAQKLCHLLSE